MNDPNPHVEVENLTLTVRGPDGTEHKIVDDVSFSIERGGVLALIGESGSGKTTIALSLLGHFRPGIALAAGQVRVGKHDLFSLSPSALQALRGNRIAYIAQSAASAFNPSRTIMDQVIEAAVSHKRMSHVAAQEKARALFRTLSLPKPETIGDRYPHQLSGGQLQRLMAAMALICDPELVILDEPTTALDVTTQIDVLRAFKAAVKQQNATAVYVSHDLAVVAQMADHIVVLNHGRMRESGDTRQMLNAPADDYTRSMINAVTMAEHSGAARSVSPPLLEMWGGAVGYGRPDREGRLANPVLRNIDFKIARGATFGIIGESGSGKSTLARSIAGLVPMASGDMLFDGQPLAPALAQRTKEQLRRIQMVYQNADVALNPAHCVEDILTRPLAFYHGMKGAEARSRVDELLDQIQLPRAIARRACSDLSGGQKQRINLARALAAEPDILLCDEVTSALDTIVGTAIIDLLAKLREELNLAIVFISHDVKTVRSICDDIAVLYAGDIVEEIDRRNFAEAPRHPYTRLLINSVPELRPGWLEEGRSRTDAALPSVQPREADARLCRFLPRCDSRLRGQCDRIFPSRIHLGSRHNILCHLASEKHGAA